MASSRTSVSHVGDVRARDGTGERSPPPCGPWVNCKGDVGAGVACSRLSLLFTCGAAHRGSPSVCAAPARVCSRGRPVCAAAGGPCVQPRPVCAAAARVCSPGRPVCAAPARVCSRGRPVCAAPARVCSRGRPVCAAPARVWRVRGSPIPAAPGSHLSRGHPWVDFFNISFFKKVEISTPRTPLEPKCREWKWGQ
jgi:hypothetical protein